MKLPNPWSHCRILDHIAIYLITLQNPWLITLQNPWLHCPISDHIAEYLITLQNPWSYFHIITLQTPWSHCPITDHIVLFLIILQDTWSRWIIPDHCMILARSLIILPYHDTQALQNTWQWSVGPVCSFLSLSRMTEILLTIYIKTDLNFRWAYMSEGMFLWCSGTSYLYALMVRT